MPRTTIQREIILDTLKTFDTHPSAETLYAEINKNHPTISKATIYRNLRQLSEIGEIMQLAVIDDSARFDGRLDSHYHCNCKKCGAVFDVEMACFSGINDIVQEKYNFAVDRHDVIFIGICKECAHE